MTLEVVRYSPRWSDAWDRFVLQSNNGTIFHLQCFLDYHRERSVNLAPLLLLGGKTLGPLPPARATGSTLESPVGASYGSFVTGDVSFSAALDLVDVFSEYCRSANIERTLLTPPPSIYQRIHTQNIDYALAYRGFTYDKHYISHAIEIQDSDLISTFQPTARRYVRKYIREGALQIGLSDDLDSFYPILIKNKQKHGVLPTHSLEELKRLKQMFPDRILLFLVQYKKKPIAGSLLFVCNPQVILCFYNMLLYEFEHFHPIHAVMYEALRWTRNRQFRWFDVGVSQDTHAEDQMTPAMSLIRFKEQFNARGILRSTMYKRFI